MIYFQVALAAIRRYRIEKPLREMYLAIKPESKKRIPFGVMLMYLRKEGALTPKDARYTEKCYKKYSDLLHGSL